MTARVLVMVSGGVAECFADEGVETHIFDRDAYVYAGAPDVDRLDIRVPNSFKALAVKAGVPYMPGDEELTAAELAAKYGGVDGRAQHPEHQLSRWLNAASVHQTRLGYWDWVIQQLKVSA